MNWLRRALKAMAGDRPPRPAIGSYRIVTRQVDLADAEGHENWAVQLSVYKDWGMGTRMLAWGSVWSSKGYTSEQGALGAGQRERLRRETEAATRRVHP